MYFYILHKFPKKSFVNWMIVIKNLMQFTNDFCEKLFIQKHPCTQHISLIKRKQNGIKETKVKKIRC
jgi:hypothetical protein